MGTQPSSPKEAQPPISGPYLLRLNGCTDQDVTWYGARPQPRRLCVRWGPNPLPLKRGAAPSPIFGPFLLWPNGSMHQDATCMDVGCSPGDFVLDGYPAPCQKGRGARGGAPPLIFGPCLLWPNGWMHQDATWYGGRPQPRRFCIRWGRSPLPQKRAEPPPHFRPISIAPKRLIHQDAN